MSELKYKRILLKLSGEVDWRPNRVSASMWMKRNQSHSRIKEVYNMGVEIAVVIGAGNLWRGKQGLERGMDRSTADYMGMLGHGDEFDGPDGCAGTHRCVHTRDVSHRDARRGRTLYPPTRHPPPRKRTRGDLRRGHRQSVFFHGYRRGIARL